MTVAGVDGERLVDRHRPRRPLAGQHPRRLPWPRRRRRTRPARAPTTGTSNTCAAIARTAGFCAAPPMSSSRSARDALARAPRRGRRRARTACPRSPRARSTAGSCSRASAPRTRRSRRAGSACARPRSTARARHRMPRAPPRARGDRARSWSTPSRPRGGVEHPRRVERRDEGQEVARRIGEPRDRARGVGDRGIGDGEHRAARADRHDDVTGCRVEAERGRRVVARTRADEDAVGRAPGRLAGAEHAREDRVVTERRAPAARGRSPSAPQYAVPLASERSVASSSSTGPSGDSPIGP